MLILSLANLCLTIGINYIHRKSVYNEQLSVHFIPINVYNSIFKILMEHPENLSARKIYFQAHGEEWGVDSLSLEKSV